MLGRVRKRRRLLKQMNDSTRHCHKVHRKCRNYACMSTFFCTDMNVSFNSIFPKLFKVPSCNERHWSHTKAQEVRNAWVEIKRTGEGQEAKPGSLTKGLGFVNTWLLKENEHKERVSKELVLPKLVDRTVIEIQQYFSCCCFCFVLLCVELDNLIFKFPWKSKGPRITEKQFWKSTRWKNLSYQISTFIVKIFSKEDSVGRAPETLMEQTREPPRACPSWETTQGRGDITVSMQKEWSVW